MSARRPRLIVPESPRPPTCGACEHFGAGEYYDSCQHPHTQAKWLSTYARCVDGADKPPTWCPLPVESERHAITARHIARAARKSQAMPRNPIVLEPISSMRDRAARARRQWVAAVVEVLRWAAT